MLTLAPLYFDGTIQFGVISQGYPYYSQACSTFPSASTTAGASGAGAGAAAASLPLILVFLYVLRAFILRSMAFRTILGALSFVVSRFDTLGGLVAETARITALEQQLSTEGRYGT